MNYQGAYSDIIISQRQDRTPKTKGFYENLQLIVNEERNRIQNAQKERDKKYRQTNYGNIYKFQNSNNKINCVSKEISTLDLKNIVSGRKMKERMSKTFLNEKAEKTQERLYKSSLKQRIAKRQHITNKENLQVKRAQTSEGINLQFPRRRKIQKPANQTIAKHSQTNSKSVDQEEDNSLNNTETNIYPSKLKSHLKEISQLGKDLKQIQKESKKSVMNHIHFRQFLKKSSKKTKNINQQESQDECSNNSSKDIPQNVYEDKSNYKKLNQLMKDHSEKLTFVEKRIKNQCKGELGIINPFKAFECLNDIQKEECPQAYQPEMVIQYQKKQQLRQMKEDLDFDIDKTLFDFDDEIDKLSEVEERYKAFPQTEVKDSGPKQEEQERGGQNLEQGTNIDINAMKSDLIMDLKDHSAKNREAYTPMAAKKVRKISKKKVNQAIINTGVTLHNKEDSFEISNQKAFHSRKSSQVVIKGGKKEIMKNIVHVEKVKPFSKNRSNKFHQSVQRGFFRLNNRIYQNEDNRVLFTSHNFENQRAQLRPFTSSNTLRNQGPTKSTNQSGLDLSNQNGLNFSNITGPENRAKDLMLKRPVYDQRQSMNSSKVEGNYADRMKRFFCENIQRQTNNLFTKIHDQKSNFKNPYQVGTQSAINQIMSQTSSLRFIS